MEEKNIELEGTKAQVRLIERYQYQKSDSHPNLDSTELTTPPPVYVSSTESGNTKAQSRALDRYQYQKPTDSNFDSNELTTPTRRPDQLSTPSMKAMTPLALADETTNQNTSSTESAHDQKNGIDLSTPRRKPSRIPLPGAQVAPTPSRISTSSIHSSKNASSLPRPGSAQSGSSLSGAKSATSIPLRSSLTGRLRNDSLSKPVTPTTQVVHTPGRSTSVCNKRDGLTRAVRRGNNTTPRTAMNDNHETKVRPAKLPFWSNWLKILDNGPS